MGFDGVMDGVEVFGRVVVLAKKSDGVVGGELRGLRSLGGVFSNMNAIVEIGSGEEDFESEVLGFREATGVEDYALNVLEVVCGIAFVLGD